MVGRFLFPFAPMTPSLPRPFTRAILSVATLSVATMACTLAPRASGGEMSAIRVQTGAPDPVQQAFERVLLRRASADLEVEEVAPVHARATAIVTGLGGRIERDQVSEKSATIVLRVPDTQLEMALDSLATLGDMKSRVISVQDVTMAVIDLDARIASLVAARDRLRELHARAASVAEILEVERELSRVQGELDSLEGRRAFLRDASALSHLELSIQRRVVLGPIGVVAKGVGWGVEKLFVWR